MKIVDLEDPVFFGLCLAGLEISRRPRLMEWRRAAIQDTRLSSRCNERTASFSLCMDLMAMVLQPCIAG